jgi:hypothetical protein
MNWSNTIRQLHRWVSIAFTVAVIVNIAAMTQTQAPLWISLLALVPLIVMLGTGLYLFARPYMAPKMAKAERRADAIGRSASSHSSDLTRRRGIARR